MEQKHFHIFVAQLVHLPALPLQKHKDFAFKVVSFYLWSTLVNLDKGKVLYKYVSIDLSWVFKKGFPGFVSQKKIWFSNRNLVMLLQLRTSTYETVLLTVKGQHYLICFWYFTGPLLQDQSLEF